MNKTIETSKAVVSFIYGVVASLLGLRFVFRLFDANPANGFVDFIYDASAPLVAPFETIFDSPVAGNGSVFDSAAVVALLIYGLGVYLVMWLIKTVATPAEVDKQNKTVEPSADKADEKDDKK